MNGTRLRELAEVLGEKIVHPEIHPPAAIGFLG
jgi:hypothetical protein